MERRGFIQHFDFGKESFVNLALNGVEASFGTSQIQLSVILGLGRVLLFGFGVIESFRLFLEI